MARDRARTSCSRRASRRRNRRVSSSGAHTPSSSPAHNNRATVRASSRSVFARACAIPVSPGLTTTTLATGGSRIATIAHAPPDTSNATRSSGPRLAASISSASGELSTRSAERTLPSSQIATSQKSRCTSNPIALPSALTHTSSSIDIGENSGQTTTTDTRSQRTRASRRGGHRITTGSQPIVQTGPPTTFPKKAPQPRSPLTTRPGKDFLSTDFHAPSTKRVASRAERARNPKPSESVPAEAREVWRSS